MEEFPLDDIACKAGSRFAVVVAAADRAQQIKDGSPVLVDVASRNPLTIALAEIAAGKVIIVPAEPGEEEIRATTSDQYYAGRDGSVEDTIILPREPAAAGTSAARAKHDDDEDLLDDDLDDDLHDDEEDEEDEELDV